MLCMPAARRPSAQNISDEMLYGFQVGLRAPDLHPISTIDVTGYPYAIAPNPAAPYCGQRQQQQLQEYQLKLLHQQSFLHQQQLLGQNEQRHDHQRHQKHQQPLISTQIDVKNIRNGEVRLGGGGGGRGGVRERRWRRASSKTSPTTSFSIADILEGRVGKKNVSTSPSSSDGECNLSRRGGEIGAGGAGGGRGAREGLEVGGGWDAEQFIVRPWDDNRDAGSSSTSVLSTGVSSSREHFDEDRDVDDNFDGEFDNDDDDDDDDDDGGDEIDVVDEEQDCGRRKTRRLAARQALMSSCDQLSNDDVISRETDDISTGCPLDALLRMASQTNFERSLQERNSLGYASDDSESQMDGGLCTTYRIGHSSSKSRSSRSGCGPSSKKRRKTRTAFTNQQIFQLEKRFVYQKYLTPSDRDEIALTLRLSNAQVITWFQNRRAKLKRDLEELKADVMAAKALGTEPSSTVLNRLEELMQANEYGLRKKDCGNGNSSKTESIHAKASSASKTDEREHHRPQRQLSKSPSKTGIIKEKIREKQSS